MIAKIKLKQDNLVRLLHQSPRLFNINRNTWRYQDLANVYKQEYGKYIGISNVAHHLQLRNYGFKKSTERLTSHDPKFREKLDYIKSILSNLGPDENSFQSMSMDTLRLK